MSTAAVKNEFSQGVISRPRQSRFLMIPQTPVCYWLRERFFELLAGKTLGDVADVCQGLATANDPRFVRFFWESPNGGWALPVRSRRWVPFEKGGGYGKWFGHHFWVVDWEHRGARIKAFPASVVRNEQHYFKKGWTYSSLARGSLSVRWMQDSIWGAVLADAIIPRNGAFAIAFCLNSRVASANIRSFRPQIVLSSSYVTRLPLPEEIPISLSKIEVLCIVLKRRIVEFDLTERNFAVPCSRIAILGSSYIPAFGETEAIAAMLHTLEGVLERMVFAAYGLSGEDLQAVLDEAGTPAAWFPLIKDYDTLPPLNSTLSLNGGGEWDQGYLLDDVGRLYIEGGELDVVKQRLRRLYQAGRGVKEEINGEDTDAQDKDEEESDDVAVGAQIPVPAETFLEELSQRLEIHPISVYWLLKEGIEREGWRCLPEEQRLTKDRFTVLILRLLGHRWPKQIEAGETLPDWADDDGIIPLMEGTEESTLYQRLRSRIAADHGDDQVSSQENAFAEVMGKPLAEWVRKDFFRHHVSQFKKRPIAWHLSSAKWSGRLRQDAAFECMVYYHKTDGDLLPKLKNQYVIPLMKRLQTELRGLENANGSLTGEQETRKSLLTERIRELNAFDAVLTDVSAGGFGPEPLRPQLRQYAINDAMLCLKAQWLKRLSGVIQKGPLPDWQRQADETGLHEDFSTWIMDAMTHLDYHCAVVGPKPPLEKTLDNDPASKEFAAMICAESEDMLTGAMKNACLVWWKSFDTAILKPISVKIRDFKNEVQSLKEQTFDTKVDDSRDPLELKRKMNALKSEIKAWQKELALKSGQGQTVRGVIESWSCPEVLTWETWFGEQAMYDQLSSLNGKRPPPQTIAEFIRQECLYQPDINDGVRVNIAPLQKAGLLTADVLAAKDVDKAIADRAVWRDDERRWCREGKLPKPGWWEAG